MQRWRHTAHWLLALFVACTGGIWWAKRALRKRRAVSILMLHRVLDDAQFALTNSLPGMVIRKQTLEQMARYCLRYCDPVAVNRLAVKRSTERLGVAFTFDDGWIDTYENAYPVLTARGIPMAVFVCPLLTGCGSPFWPERVVGSLRAQHPGVAICEIEEEVERLKGNSTATPVCGMVEGPAGAGTIDSTMSWSQIQELDEDCVILGSHTNSHPILTRVNEDEARTEIEDSKARLEFRLHKKCTAFAYPNGDHSKQTRTLLDEAGFELAFTTKRGAWTPECDPLAIPRANICEDNVTDSHGEFSPLLFEYFVFWNGWRAMRHQR